ncbi:MAG: acyl-CoA thioesterase [Planctomycetota bacterium]|nr:MAG: acyl-CoA thioesterase [Planctomycetota bacterium]REJ95347.1 MAG: acyl-CoA thioesterase [Planctomycetota bacterium]REK24541.1 MAG: acyl-CoA thioesterase [Planctomycetota bacterium]REK28846.1 MAG: acyl-CoA thioesterase [Planctomycetota bacterium]
MPDPDSHEIRIRVRYSESDPMGLLHHSRYLSYFEMGRMELFRAQGGDYREMESRGLFVVVLKLQCEFKRPAKFDDLLTLTTRIANVTPAKLEHDYELRRGDELLARARVVLACVDRTGAVQQLTRDVLFGAPGS